MYQYQFFVNGARSKILDRYPKDEWENIAKLSDLRPTSAVLERRLVTDPGIIEGLTYKDEFFVIKDRAIQKWETIAKIDSD